MPPFDDRASRSSDRASASADPLTEVVRGVRLTGALFFLVDATSPWCVAVPETGCFSRQLLPRAQHILSYHVVVEGRGIAQVPGEDPVAFEEGDVIVFPHGDAYRMESAPGVEPEFSEAEMLGFFAAMAAGDLPFTVPEGGGKPPPAKFVCGFLGCDLRPFNPLLAHLPRLMKVNARQSQSLDTLVDLTLKEARNPRAGSEAMRLRLSELLFLEVVRAHLDTRPDLDGFLGGIADPAVGRALALLHAAPAQPWTLERLAREAGVSRSVLAERFRARMGEGPMGYLARWRVQLAAVHLSENVLPLAEIAETVGYSSSEALSRAFKRETGLPPRAWLEAAEG